MYSATDLVRYRQHRIVVHAIDNSAGCMEEFVTRVITLTVFRAQTTVDFITFLYSVAMVSGHLAGIRFGQKNMNVSAKTMAPKNLDVLAKKMDVSAKKDLIVLQNRILFVGGFTE